MRRLVTGAGLLSMALLAACGTPQQQCIRQVSSDLRQLEEERAVRARNLDRGYRLERRLNPFPATRVCRNAQGQAFVCADPLDRWDDVPVPINRRIEAQRIEVLDELIARESRRVAPAQQQCRVTYPEA